MPTIVANGNNLYYEVHGHGPLRVLIPGLGYNGWMWHKMMPGLAEKFQVISIDNRGSGLSDKPPGPYTAQMLAADVIGLLDAFDVRQAHIVGHSMGGRAAVRLIDHPAVLGVVGLAPWLPLGEPLGNVAGRWLLIAHGDADRTTYPEVSLDFVERARAAGARATHVIVASEGHALMRNPRWWNRYIIDSVVEILS